MNENINSIMTTEERFNAAANVIRNLPKNGAYQPSEELMLRFYSYYKQATEGPCNCSRPAFWQVVKKARWEAWSGLGDMSKEEAMIHYVEELKGIIETMSYNEDVANFLDSLDLFYENKLISNPKDDAGSVLDQSNSHSNSSLSNASVETTLCKDIDNTDIFTSSFETCRESISNSIDPYHLETEPEDEFTDSIDYISDNLQRQYLKNYINENHSRCDYINNKNKSNLDCESMNDDIDFRQCNNVSNYVKTILNHDINKNTDFNSTQLNMEFMNQVMMTLRDLQNNLDQVVNRLGNVEKKIQYSSKMQLNAKNEKKSNVIL